MDVARRADSRTDPAEDDRRARLIWLVAEGRTSDQFRQQPALLERRFRFGGLHQAGDDQSVSFFSGPAAGPRRGLAPGGGGREPGCIHRSPQTILRQLPSPPTSVRKLQRTTANCYSARPEARSKPMRSVIAITFALSTLAPALYAAPVSGEAVYQQRCAACHDAANPRVPPRDELKKLSVTRILRALDFGEMNNVASKLRQDEREAVASYLGVPGGNVQFPAKAYCADRTVRLI